MPLNKAKGRMFKSVGWTWNPIVGCVHNCPYCWARKRVKDFHTPRINYKTLMDKLPDDHTWIFIGSVSDIFNYGFSPRQIDEILYVIREYQGSCKFLLQSKDPVRGIQFLKELKEVKDKIIMGTTIETNRETLGSAPPTIERYAAMLFFKKLGFKTFVSLEPLSYFDVIQLKDWIEDIGPEAVEIGLENYTHFTEKPPCLEIDQLIRWLKILGVPYKLKDNLSHMEAKP